MIRERDRVANDSLRRGRLDLESDRPLIQAQWRHPAGKSRSYCLRFPRAVLRLMAAFTESVARAAFDLEDQHRPSGAAAMGYDHANAFDRESHSHLHSANRARGGPRSNPSPAPQQSSRKSVTNRP